MDICSVIRATLASHVKSCQPLGHLTVAILRLVCLSHQVSSCCLKPCLSLCYMFNVSGTKFHRFTANKSIFPESVFLPAQTDTQKDTCTPTSYIYLGSKFKNTWCSYYMEAKYLHTLYTHALKNKVLSAVGWICLSPLSDHQDASFHFTWKIKHQKIVSKISWTCKALISILSLSQGWYLQADKASSSQQTAIWMFTVGALKMPVIPTEVQLVGVCLPCSEDVWKPAGLAPGCKTKVI